MARPLPQGTWKFYVYEFVDDSGQVLYIGKGSGGRLSDQRRKKPGVGREVARFWKEDHAYAFERQRIAEVSPALNKRPGGSGGRYGQSGGIWREIQRIGTRAYAARLLLKFDASLYRDPERLAKTRKVAGFDPIRPFVAN